jgi:hypothetical protein
MFALLALSAAKRVRELFVCYICVLCLEGLARTFPRIRSQGRARNVIALRNVGTVKLSSPRGQRIGTITRNDHTATISFVIAINVTRLLSRKASTLINRSRSR